MNKLEELKKAFDAFYKEQMEASEVSGIDPLEGKAVEGFSGGVNIGLNHGEHHLWYSSGQNNWGVLSHAQQPDPHHLTRVTERKVGRFYLMEFSDGSHPTHFGLYLGDKNVRWIEDENYPLFIAHSFTGLTMYEVTPSQP